MAAGKSPKKGSNILCRVSNPTPTMVCRYVKRLPKIEMPESDFRALMGSTWFANEHQAPEQWGLYYIDGTTYHPRFFRDITEEEAKSYLLRWTRRMIVINPYTKFKASNDRNLVLSIVRHLEDNPSVHDLKTIMRDIINSEEPFIINDILANTLNNYSGVLNVTAIDKKSERFDVSLTDNYKEIINKEYMTKEEYFHLFDEIVDNQSLNTFQKIYYGAPGTGKSYHLKKDVAGKACIRTTFHPDSDYSTFVGVYKPVEIEVEKKQVVWDFASKKAIELPVCMPDGTPAPNEKKITYKYIMQPFMQAYVAAWKKLAQFVPTPATPVVPSISTVSGTAVSPYTVSSMGDLVDGFKYEPRNGMDLSSDEIKALKLVDSFILPYSGCETIKELHDKITLIITDKGERDDKVTSTRGVLKAILKGLYEKLEERHDALNPNTDFPIRDLIGILESTLDVNRKTIDETDLDPDEVIELPYRYEILGKCIKDRDEVYLYMDTIRGALRFKDYLPRLVSTYIHEMFHYLFKEKNYPSQVEEVIVECCMLCVLEKMEPIVNDSNWSGITGKCFDSVKDKQFNLPHYGFGAFLFENRSLDWMKIYSEAPSHANSSDPRLKEYLEKLLIYPYGNEQNVMELLYSFLTEPMTVRETKPEAQYLVIEEINRGNCAQVFGDIFQLLDRRRNGFSEYPVTANADLQRALKKEFEGMALPSYIDNCFLDYNGLPMTFKWSDDGTEKEGKASQAIMAGAVLAIPENLYIYASMNTSDQSLFPMDSAFKRRWEWKFFSIKDGHKDYKIQILEGGMVYDWWKTIEALNKKIYATTKSADKQLGYWFVNVPEGKNIINKETFVSKVVFYLWNDVFKDYGFGDNNAFTPETRFEAFYDDEGNVVEETAEAFIKRALNIVDTPKP